MVRDDLCGTYWYCVNESGSKWITKGDRPIASNGGFSFVNSDMGWLQINRPSDYTFDKGIRIESKEFKDVNFPERTYEDGPLEIEIVKSGNVYWYDD